MTVRPPAIRTALPAPAALLALTAAALLAAAPPPPRTAPTAPARAFPAGSAPRAATTVEPTLPLRLDVAFESFERSGVRGRGRVRIDIVALDEIRDLEIEMLHDSALSIPEEASLRHERLHLRPGEARVFRWDLEAKDDRDLPLRLEATFRTADGTLLRLGQGGTLPGSQPRPQGRLHLGALEYPALVLDGPLP